MPTPRARGRFNPPPSWPEPGIADWQPPEGWSAPDSLPEPPQGWALYWDASARTDAPEPVERAERLPAVGARETRPEDYPAMVDLPGNVIPVNDQASDVPKRVRTGHGRLSPAALNWILGLIGIVIALATIAAFIWLYNFAVTTLPSVEALAISSLLPRGTSSVVSS